MIGLILRYHSRRAVRYFHTRRIAKLITVMLFCFVGGAVGAGVYFFFLSSFRYAGQEVFFRLALPLYLHELFLLVTCYLVFVSGVITSLFTVFRSEDGWIMAGPRFRVLVGYTFGKVFLSSLWPFLFIGVPALLAVRQVSGLSLAGFALSICSLILLTAISVGSALLLVLLCAFGLEWLTRITGVPSRHILTIRSISGLMAFIVFLFSLVVWRHIAAIDLVELFQINDLEKLSASIGSIIHQFRFFPSSLAALTIFASGTGNFSSAFLMLGQLFSLLIFVCFWILFLSRSFLPLWQALQEGRFEARRVAAAPHHFGLSVAPQAFPRFFKSKIGALIEKEGLATLRNTRNLLWIAFMVLLMFLQIGFTSFSRGAAVRYADISVIRSAFAQTLQVATILYFIAAFVLRFAFPAFSTEKRTAWIVAAAPVDLKTVFWAKGFFYTAFFVCIGLIMGVLSLAAASGLTSAIVLILLFTAIVTVTAIGFSMGALFPNFETDDPQILSTSLPGLCFIGLALLYGAISSLLLYRVLAGASSLGAAFLFIIASFVLSGLLLKLSSHSLDKIEFAGYQGAPANSDL